MIFFSQENGCQLSLMAVVIDTIAAFGCMQHTVRVKVAYHVICLQRENIYQCLWLRCISLVLPHVAKGGVLKLLQDAPHPSPTVVRFSSYNRATKGMGSSRGLRRFRKMQNENILPS